MSNEKVKALIARHEGRREKIYIDTVGVPTVGVGHALLVGSKFPAAAVDALFEADLDRVEADYAALVKEGVLPGNLDEVRRAVIMDMLFNLGKPKLLEFKITLAALRKGDYDTTVRGMRCSRWARQVGGRADELCAMMETGQWPPFLAK